MTIPSMNKLSTVFPIMIEKYEQFIPNIEGMGVPDKINAIIQYLNRIGKLSNDVVADWNKVMVWVMDEGLNDSVIAKVDDLIAQGTFDDLLNGMFDTINNANTAFQTTVNSSLTDKAKKSNSYKLISEYSNLFANNDWVPAINKAMSDLVTSGGGKLLFETGNYNMKSGIVVPDGVYLEGVGKNSTKLTADPLVSGVFINLGKNVNSGVCHLSLNGNRYGQSTNLTVGLKLGLSDTDTVWVNTDGLEVHNIMIQNFYGNGLECYRKYGVNNLYDIVIHRCTVIGLKANCTDNNFSNFWINNCPTGLYIGGAANKFSNFKLDFCGSDTTGAVHADGQGQISLSNIEVQGAQGKAYIFNNCTSFFLSNVYADSSGVLPYVGNNATAFTFTGCKNFVGTIGITEDPVNTSNIFLKTGISVDSNCKDLNLNTLIKGLVPYTYKQISVGAEKIILDSKSYMKNTLLSGYSSLNSVEPSFSTLVSQGKVSTAHATYVQNGDSSVTVTVSSADSTHRLGFSAIGLQQNHVYLCYAEIDTNLYNVTFRIINNNSPFTSYSGPTYLANSVGYLSQYGLIVYKDDPVAMNPSVYLSTTTTGDDTFTFKNLMLIDVTDIIQDVDSDTIIDVVKNNIGFFYGATKGVGANSQLNTYTKRGTLTYSGDGVATSKTIAHGLGVVPTYFHVELASSGAGTAGKKYVTADATNLTVFFNTAPVTGTNNVVLNWKAESN